MEAQVTVVPPGQRQRPPPAQDVDELSLDAPRTSLLDVLDAQLRPHTLVSRLLCVCQIDEKRQKELEDKFTSWVTQESEITGVLAFLGPVALHLLEGPTKKLFNALVHFNSFSEDDGAGSLLSNLKILYLSELYTDRVAVDWCAFSHTPKGNIGALGDVREADRVFHAYKTIVTACEKVSGQVPRCSSKEYRANAPEKFRNTADTLIALEDLHILLSKESKNPFTFEQFVSFFIEPVVLQLESDKLWPMPPAPVY